VKPLGVYAMIDQNELDWKVVAIRADDPKAALLHDTDSVRTHLPGELERIREWFRSYKVPDGKDENKFAHGEQCLGCCKAMDVVRKAHASYNENRQSLTQVFGIKPLDGESLRLA
jgi:inorganic pyrophosphatase